MEIKMADGKSIKKVFGLVPGKPGLGKTTQLTSFPKDKTLGVSIEDGFLSVEGSGYAYVEVRNYDQLMDVLTNVQKKAPWCEYLYIDSLTEIYDHLKHELKNKYTAKQNFQKHEDMIDFMLHAIRTARQLPINVFFTCHTKEDKDGMAIVQNLAFDGKLPEQVLKQFDLSFHLDWVTGPDGQNHRALITSPEISKIAKRRLSPWMNAQVEDYEEPNLYKLTQKLLGKS